MLMARDTARDEAQKLHRKWLKHQAFMAELARNKEWLAKIEQVSGGDCRGWGEHMTDPMVDVVAASIHPSCSGWGGGLPSCHQERGSRPQTCPPTGPQ